MNAPHIAKPLSRRRFLQSAGVTLGLPLLECMTPVFGRAAQAKAPRRMLIISNNLGFLPKPFGPKTLLDKVASVLEIEAKRAA